MFEDQMHEPKAQHIFFVGSDIKEKRYTFVENDEKLGEVFFFPVDDKEIYIDSLTVFENHQRNGVGTRMVEELAVQFPNLKKITGFATKEILEGFWAKQPGYQFNGEGSDQQEGYYWFLIRK